MVKRRVPFQGKFPFWETDSARRPRFQMIAQNDGSGERDRKGTTLEMRDDLKSDGFYNDTLNAYSETKGSRKNF